MVTRVSLLSGRLSSPPLPPPPSPLPPPRTSSPPRCGSPCSEEGEGEGVEGEGVEGEGRSLAWSLQPLPLVRAPLALRWHLDALTIEDVAVILGELGLNKHVGKFRKHRIDGVLLQLLTADILVTEFRMKRVESILLRTFITQGHIPKRSPRRSRKSLPAPFGHAQGY